LPGTAALDEDAALHFSGGEMKRILVILVVCLATGGAAVVAADSNQGGIPARVAALEAAVADLLARVTGLETHFQTGPIDVDCGAGGTIGAALQQANGRPGAVGIRITGVCVESVVISRHAVRLFAGAPGAGITPPNPNQTALIVSAARDVVVDGLTLTGGNSAMSLNHGGQATVRNSVITGASIAGLTLDNGGVVELQNTNVTGNFDGISANGGSSVRVIGGRIANTRIGVGLYTGSTVSLDGGALVTGNQSASNVRFGATLNTRTATIENNGGGISVKGGSSLLLGGNTIIQNNTGHGVTLEDTSVVGVLGSDQPQIINNTGWGVRCAAAPAVAMIASGGAGIITGNAMGQTNCPVSPSS
jgi:hypothetical protein